MTVKGLVSDDLGLNESGPLIWAVIKANAYGHGVENAVSAFANADGLAMIDF
jgi:alanine racemase